MNRGTLIRTAAAMCAAALVWFAATLPLWTMTLRAPQYPKGLRIDAYGTGVTGDLKELNILNHYIGMRPLDPAPPLETRAFPIAVAGIVLLCLASPLHRWLRRAAVAGALAVPIGLLIDLQWWLYSYGHSLNPKAPIRLDPFTPLVIGTSSMGNFTSTGMISTGVLGFLAAAIMLAAGARLSRRFAQPRASTRHLRAAAAATLVTLACGGALAARERPWPRDPSRPLAGSIALQTLIDAAAPGSTLMIQPGLYAGPVTIRGPLTVEGIAMPVIDGGGHGSVVTIDGDGVVLRGFAIRHSGRNVTEEAAGITATGSGHRIEDNDIRDVYFGIHVAGGAGHAIERNVIAPGEHHGARPGHGVSLWRTTDSRVAGNRISEARDGVYLSFTRAMLVEHNDVTRCRYGLHSMYSEQARFIGNRLTANLLGSALMNSDRLELRGNRIEQHRQGSAAYGILLKDIGDLIAEDNVITANRIGLYAEGVPDRPAREALLRRNIFAGNEVGMALQHNVAMTLSGNRFADNLTDVRPLGSGLSPGMRWSRDGRGNSWNQYRGYDSNRDGIGDLPHRMDDAVDALMRRSGAAQAFLYTPAHLALEAAARMFPLFRRAPVLIDEHPLMQWTGRPTRTP